MMQFFNKHSRVLFFILSVSLSCGIVFFGIILAFSFMLSENGFSTSKISTVFLASSPYSFKFAISPFIKNILYKYSKSNFNILKILAFTSQIITILGISSLGFFTNTSSLILIFITVFTTSIAGSIHDILADYLRIVYFNRKTLGMATSIGTIGFRLGMLIAGAGTLYLASFFNWKIAFIIVSLSILMSSISTIILPNKSFIRIDEDNQSISQISSVKNYLYFCRDIIKKYSIPLIIIITFSFKFSDSCINSLKPIFLQTLGIGKVDFANISQLIGSAVIIISGSIAGSLTYSLGTKKCILISFIIQILSSICYILITYLEINIISIAILVNISTFFFGFSAVIYRTYISEISMSDINKYTIFLSMGSIGRTLSSSFGGYIVSLLSWKILFILCVISNIPGLYAISFHKKSKKFI